MDDYGNEEGRQIKTFAEKCLPPLGTYLVRKCVLGCETVFQGLWI